MVKIRSASVVLFSAALGLLATSCNSKDFAQPNLAAPSQGSFGESVLIGGPEGAAGELVSPASVTVRVQDVAGTGGTLVAVDATFRNADRLALAEGKWTREVAIPPNGTGEAALELSWKPPTAAARYLDLAITTRDSAGAVHVQNTTLMGAKKGQWMAW